MNEFGEALAELIDAGLGYTWLIALAIWGGTVNYLSRIRQGKVEAFSIVELFGEWATSGFAGLLTAFVCAELSLSWHMTAFFAGVSGHLGGRAIFLFEEYVKRRFPGIDEKIAKAVSDDEDQKNGN